MQSKLSDLDDNVSYINKKKKKRKRKKKNAKHAWNKKVLNQDVILLILKIINHVTNVKM